MRSGRDSNTSYLILYYFINFNINELNINEELYVPSEIKPLILKGYDLIKIKTSKKCYKLKKVIPYVKLFLLRKISIKK